MFWSVAAQAQGNFLPALYDMRGIPEDDVLEVREAPSALAPILAELPHGTTRIEVIDVSESGNWGLINVGEQAGWVSMNHLRLHGAAFWWDMVEPLWCYGVEPNWSLHLPPNAPGRLDSFGQSEVELTMDWQAPAWDSPVTRAFSVSTETRRGFAVVQRERCTDTMSDREFGLRIRMFLDGNGDPRAPAAFSGCCTQQDFTSSGDNP